LRFVDAGESVGVIFCPVGGGWVADAVLVDGSVDAGKVESPQALVDRTLV
jgi:hypothetical protein